MGDNSLRDQLVEEMKGVFGSDQRRIDHALHVLYYAEDIQKVEGGDLLTVQAAALLHDIGIPEAERKYGSAAPEYQEQEGPPIARKILEKLGVEPHKTHHVGRIVGEHHSAKELNTLEFRVVWDADMLVNVGDEMPPENEHHLQQLIDEGRFRTRRGAVLARRYFEPEMPEGEEPQEEVPT